MKSVPFKSFSAENGFDSPGFTVSDDGNLIITGSITFSGNLISDNTINFNGTSVFEGNTLDSSITQSSLTTLGTLVDLTVSGDTNIGGTLEVTQDTTIGGNLIVTGTSTINSDMNILSNLSVTGDLTVSNGTVSVASSQVGSIDNVNIGSTTSASGIFTNLEATSQVVLNPVTTGSMDNIDIGQTVAGTAKFTTASITTEPAQPTDITNKDYVDKNIAVLAIALGA